MEITNDNKEICTIHEFRCCDGNKCSECGFDILEQNRRRRLLLKKGMKVNKRGLYYLNVSREG